MSQRTMVVITICIGTPVLITSLYYHKNSLQPEIYVERYTRILNIQLLSFNINHYSSSSRHCYMYTLTLHTVQWFTFSISRYFFIIFYLTLTIYIFLYLTITLYFPLSLNYCLLFLSLSNYNFLSFSTVSQRKYIYFLYYNFVFFSISQ